MLSINFIFHSFVSFNTGDDIQFWTGRICVYHEKYISITHEFKILMTIYFIIYPHTKLFFQFNSIFINVAEIHNIYVSGYDSVKSQIQISTTKGLEARWEDRHFDKFHFEPLR